MRLPRLFNRRQKLTERLRKFTEASGTLPKTPQPTPYTPGTLEYHERVNTSGVWQR